MFFLNLQINVFSIYALHIDSSGRSTDAVVRHVSFVEITCVSNCTANFDYGSLIPTSKTPPARK